MDISAAEDFIMKWGKHEGEMLSDIPSDYIRWLSTDAESDLVREAADAVYNHREETNTHFWE